MPSENEIIIAFLFKRSGKSMLSFSELYLALSIDLNWFTPEDAKAFLNLILKQKLLAKKGEVFHPNFDYDKTVLPMSFTPSKHVFKVKEIEKNEEKDKSVLSKIIKRLIEKTALNRTQVNELISSVVEEKNITADVAALLVGKEYAVSLEEYFGEVEENIF